MINKQQSSDNYLSKYLYLNYFEKKKTGNVNKPKVELLKSFDICAC